jgi:hypothetical protein
VAFLVGFGVIGLPTLGPSHRTPPETLIDCRALLQQARAHLQKSIDSRVTSNSTAWGIAALAELQLYQAEHCQ